MSTEQILDRFAAALRASPHNLLSPRGLAELETRHLPEALALAERLPRDRGTRLADVGSGGGLPGMVIAAARPDLEVTLIESIAKKADWLAETAAQLGVPVAVRNARAEALHDELGGHFDLVTARAVAPLERLVPWTLPLLRRGGLLFAPKGERWAEELADAREVLARAGASIVATPDDPGGTDRGVDPPLRLVIIGSRLG